MLLLTTVFVAVVPAAALASTAVPKPATRRAAFGTVATGPLIGLGMTGYLALVSAMVTALVPM
ncbi:hypothetical protein ABZV25_14160, partial [Micrococcus luteus]